SAVSPVAAASQPARPILMIPGPIEFHPDVLKKMGEPTSDTGRQQEEGGRGEEEQMATQGGDSPFSSPNLAFLLSAAPFPPQLTLCFSSPPPSFSCMCVFPA